MITLKFPAMSIRRRLPRFGMPSRFVLIASTVFGLPSVAMATDGITQGTIIASIQNSESGGYSNPWGVNTGNGHYGAFQQGNQALQQIGYENSDGSWNAAKSGAASLNDYLQCSSCQIKGEESYLASNWSQAEANGLVANDLGKTGADGNVYNESAILECTNYFGATGCKNYIEGNYTSGVKSAMANNPHIAADIAKASATDSSAITGSNTVVDNSANAAGGTVSAATATAQMMTYCAKEVQELMNAAGAQEVDRQTQLAGSKDFGYTLMDGNGIADDANAGSGGFSGLSSAGFAAKSCLSNLLSQVSGLSMFFTKPDLSSLMSQAINAACSAVQTGLSDAMSPLYEKVADLSNMGYVGGGGFMPGMQLFSASLGQGGSGGLVTVNSSGSSSSYGNFQSLMNGDSSWYMNSSGDGSDKVYDYSASSSSVLGGSGFNPFQ